MMTMREALQRAEIHKGRISRCQTTGDLICTLNEWKGTERQRKAYITDDREDAVLTLGAMRRIADACAS